MKKFFTACVLASAVFLFSAAHDSLAMRTWEHVDNVDVNKQWKIKFNAPINAASVDDNVYILNGSTKIETIATVEGNVIVAKPKTTLKNNTSYQLIVSEDVKDAKGRYIKEAVIVPFTTKSETVATMDFIDSFETEYDMMWNLPHRDYKNFYLVGTNDDNEIVGGYDTRKNTQLFGITIGAKSSTVTARYGEPIKAILKGNTNYTQKYTNSYGNITSGTYLIDDKYVTFFYDVHAGSTVRAIYWVTKETESTKPGFFRTDGGNSYRKGLEDLMVHLISQARVADGLNALTYTPTYNSIARDHSLDMAQNNYFSHTSLSGKSPRDRMNEGYLNFSWYGENIAYGQYSTIHAHEALMNSLGHRENILRPEFTHMISGVAFNSKNTPYYTINFYRQ